MTDLHLSDLLTTRDRDAFWAEIGTEPPVRRAFYFDQSHVWLVTGYDEATAVLKDPASFSNDINTRQDTVDVAAAAGLPDDVAPYMTETLGAYDPPDHARLRRLVSRAFTVRRVESLRPRIQTIIDELVDDFPDEPFDVIDRFALPLPVRVICELLGVPDEDAPRWQQWSSGLTAPDPTVIADSARGLVAYMSELIERKRTHSDDALLSALIEVRESDGDRLSDRELISLSLTLLLAGHETTVSVLSEGLLLLLTRPEEQRRLRGDLDQVPVAVEEMLRVAGPAEIAPMRYARRDVEVGGVRIPAGDAVQIVYATANRDPRRVEAAGSTDLAREDNPHLAFGTGIHYCLGASLARAEADLAFRTLLTRFEDLSLATDADQLRWKPGIARRLEHLPVTVTRAARPRGW
ncbi:cytochrome P450 [Brachybacterium sp. GCM10030267]|uniref:cytochrome P450 family protein n=1 Tax=unclassified Brachybacterium TaxID=2623841 RepID=UPI0036064108